MSRSTTLPFPATSHSLSTKPSRPLTTAKTPNPSERAFPMVGLIAVADYRIDTSRKCDRRLPPDCMLGYTPVVWDPQRYAPASLSLQNADTQA